jgi:hypothetical protein
VLEQKSFHVARQKRSRLWIHEVQSVVVDEHRLLLQPLRPTFGADFRLDPRTDGARKGRPLESRVRDAAASAGDIHDPSPPEWSVKDIAMSDTPRDAAAT